SCGAAASVPAPVLGPKVAPPSPRRSFPTSPPADRLLTNPSRDSSVRFNFRENLFLAGWEAGPLRTPDDPSQYTSATPAAATPGAAPHTQPGEAPTAPPGEAPTRQPGEAPTTPDAGRTGPAGPAPPPPPPAGAPRAPPARAVPTRSAIAAQHPLPAAGARLTGGLLHDW